MRWQAVGYRILFASVVAALALGHGSWAWAQDDDDDDSGEAQMAGVYVDAEGVLHKRVVRDPDGHLMRERISAARTAIDTDVFARSKLRKISLNRLEAALRANQGVPTDAMRYLAGLQRIHYVFYYPESKDIVLAGPAQGWVTNLTGRVVGAFNGRPTIQLQDLAVALRAFPPSGTQTSLIGCSIDPTPEGLARLEQFKRQVAAEYARNPNVPVETIVNGIRQALGKQTVTITGVSPKTHFAQILVEADYRMKLIGLGMEKPPVRMASYVDRASHSRVAGNAMQRWYFLPDYQCVRVTENGLAAELVGDGVKLIGEDEMVTGQGDRKKAAKGNRASRLFVNDFTVKYPKLAERSPIFAELRNLIDMAVMAALIQHEGYYEKSGWDLGILGDESQFKLETYTAPKTVETAVTARFKGSTLMTPLGGGVHIEPTLALDSENLLTDDAERLESAHQQLAPKLAEGQWWWD
ncbi:MAG: DUF1598 domain-containing protein [Pirellulales bacterium]|nr:DUF1598 domain-containing protein [Pirellulales bacterium]